MAMQNVRLDPTQRIRNDGQVDLQEHQQRVHLFTRSQIEAQRPTFAGIGKQDLSGILSSSQDGERQKAQREEEVEEKLVLRLKDGTRLELPRLTKEQYAHVSAVLASASAEQAELLMEAGRVFGAEADNEVEQGRIDGPYSPSAIKAGMNTYAEYMATTGSNSQSDILAGALVFGMYGHEQNLRDYFDKLAAEQRLASELRTDVAVLDELLADMEPGETEVFSYREVFFNEDGTQTVVTHQDVEMSKEQIEALKEKLQGQIETLGQIENRDMTKIQVMVQRWQQAMTALSNILQNIHDTQRGIIANSKA